MIGNEWKWKRLEQLRRWNQMLGDVVQQQRELKRLASNDSYIINSLKRCGIEWPTIFSLVWGEKMIDSEEFPLELRTVVANIYYREKGKEECLDLIEKKLHGIIIDLLYVLYEKQVNDLVERANKQVKLYK